MLAKSRLKEMLTKWQGLLRLRDWQIAVVVVNPRNDPSIEDNAGQVDIRQSVFTAIVELNSKLPNEQVEPTIYHELAHIKAREAFWPLREILTKRDDVALIELLNACEELMVREIESLITKMLQKGKK